MCQHASFRRVRRLKPEQNSVRQNQATVFRYAYAFVLALLDHRLPTKVKRRPLVPESYLSNLRETHLPTMPAWKTSHANTERSVLSRSSAISDEGYNHGSHLSDCTHHVYRPQSLLSTQFGFLFSTNALTPSTMFSFPSIFFHKPSINL